MFIFYILGFYILVFKNFRLEFWGEYLYRVWLLKAPPPYFFIYPPYYKYVFVKRLLGLTFKVFNMW